MLVVTVQSPTSVNHPVIQDANGAHFLVESMAAQKYTPPEVGYTEHISASEAAIAREIRDTKTQPQIIVTDTPS